MSPPVSVCLSDTENSEKKNLQETARAVSSLESALFRILDLANGDASFPHSSASKESTCNAGDPGLIPRSGRSPGEGIGYPLQYSQASLVAQTVKNLPAMWETWVQPWVGTIPWRKVWQPLQYSCLENPHGQRSLVGYSPWGRKELDTPEAT